MGGRKKGTANALTNSTRQIFDEFCRRNAPRVQEIWDALVVEDPGRALDVYAKLSEFCLPKLARTEVAAEGGSPLVIQFGVPAPSYAKD